jgi:hypothetical protein
MLVAGMTFASVAEIAQVATLDLLFFGYRKVRSSVTSASMDDSLKK